MIGAGTMRAERYGRIIRDPDARAHREEIGLSPDPLAVILSGRLDLPFDAPLFTDGGGRVVIFTNDDGPDPETETPVELIRVDGPIRITEVLRQLREERGDPGTPLRGRPARFRAAGGGRCHRRTLPHHLRDAHRRTRRPANPGRRRWPSRERLELVNLSEAEGELFARYRPRR